MSADVGSVVVCVRTEAVVKAEALREAAADIYEHGTLRRATVAEWLRQRANEVESAGRVEVHSADSPSGDRFELVNGAGETVGYIDA